MSLSAIDRFASAINTGHRALATPGTHPWPPTHTPIYPSPPRCPRPPTLLRLQPPFLPPRNPLASLAHTYTSTCTRIHAQRERKREKGGRETLTFKRATEGEGGGRHLPVTHLQPPPLSRTVSHPVFLFLAASSSSSSPLLLFCVEAFNSSYTTIKHTHTHYAYTRFTRVSFLSGILCFLSGIEFPFSSSFSFFLSFFFFFFVCFCIRLGSCSSID